MILSCGDHIGLDTLRVWVPFSRHRNDRRCRRVHVTSDVHVQVHAVQCVCRYEHGHLPVSISLIDVPLGRRVARSSLTFSSPSGTSHDTVLLFADGVYHGAAACSDAALVASR